MLFLVLFFLVAFLRKNYNITYFIWITLDFDVFCNFRDDISLSNTFVLTSMVKKSYDRVLLAVSQKWPVLLYGPTGSGKSALIAKVAQDSGNQGMP